MMDYKLSEDLQAIHDSGDIGNAVEDLIQKAKKLEERLIPDFTCFRVRDTGEVMKSGDIVLLCNKFKALGFHTHYDHYFAGQKVTDKLDGKIICQTT